MKCTNFSACSCLSIYTFILLICGIREAKVNGTFFRRSPGLLQFLTNKVLFNLPENIYECFDDHLLDADLIEGHSIQLVK